MGRLGPGDMNLPFEPSPPGMPMELGGDAVICGGVYVLAASVPVVDVGTFPAVIFRFQKFDGTTHPDLVLIAEPDEIAALLPLIARATETAIKAAGETA